MERTYVNQTSFATKDRVITAAKSIKTGRWTIRVQARSWVVTKTGLLHAKAAWFVVRAVNGRKESLTKPITKVGKVSTLLTDGFMKTTGLEWMSLRMIHGVKPIILKAPGLFRGAVVYIEPSENEGMFNLRVVDPVTTHRTLPTEVPAEVVDRAIEVFGNQVYEIEPNRR